MIMGAKVKERDLKMLTVLSLKMKDVGRVREGRHLLGMEEARK